MLLQTACPHSHWSGPAREGVRPLLQESVSQLQILVVILLTSWTLDNYSLTSRLNSYNGSQVFIYTECAHVLPNIAQCRTNVN